MENAENVLLVGRWREDDAGRKLIEKCRDSILIHDGRDFGISFFSRSK